MGQLVNFASLSNDLGLVSFLLGIHTPKQASRDPLRGNLYENMVIVDIIKGMVIVDIIKGIEKFRALASGRVTAGAVLYNGAQTFDVHGIRVFNPLKVQDIWSTLTTTGEHP